MHIEISDKEKRHFKLEGGLGVEGLIKPEKCEELAQIIDTLEDADRDLFLRSDDMRKFLMSRKFAGTLMELAGQKCLRLCFDEVIYPKKNLPAQPIRIDEAYCLQEITHGILLCLRSTPESLDPDIPHEAGTFFAFSATKEIDLSPLANSEKGLYWLIGYGRKSVVYRNTPEDPRRLDLKERGLSYGDTLPNTSHPLIFAP